MNFPLVWSYLFNIAINSWFTFFTVLLLIWPVIATLRRANPRLAAYIALIPALKLFIDPFLYRFSHWALAHGLNPVIAEKGTRTLQIIFFEYPLFGFFLHGDFGFSIADALLLSLPMLVVKLLVSLWLLGIGLNAARFALRSCQSIKQLRSVIAKCRPADIRIQSRVLKRSLEKLRVSFLYSQEITTPFATGLRNKKIVLPSVLAERLSQSELETVIAHELEHLRYADHLLFFTWDFLEAILWWIPIRRCRLVSEASCEYACDEIERKYSLSALNLASALLRVQKTQRLSSSAIMCGLNTGSLKSRVHRLTARSGQSSGKLRNYLELLVFGFISILAFGGRYWIF